MDNLIDHLIDKAHGKVASATSQAAWMANQTLLIRTLEGQLGTVQAEIERLLRELGDYTYRAWKGGSSDPRIPALCAHLDDLHGRQAHLHADLGRARAATYSPQAAHEAWQATTVTAPSPPAPLSPPPASVSPPAAIPLPPASVSPSPIMVAPPTVVPVPPAPLRSAPAAPASAMPAPSQQSGASPGPETARAAQRSSPALPARECPHCGHFVPAGTTHCPSCGFRAT